MTPGQYERARASGSAPAALFAALAAAQGEFPAIPKNKKGHGYNYAPMDTIQRLVRPVLAKHGLGFTQYMDGTHMVTLITHKSGECLPTKFPLRAIESRQMNEMQALGAVSTYAARYGLCLALGISADEDTDASTQGSAGPRLNEDFTDPARDGHVAGVHGAPQPTNNTPRARAEAAAKGIENALKNAKTEKGVVGAWDKNAAVIDRLQESYDDLYSNILDVYEARMGAVTEEAA